MEIIDTALIERIRKALIKRYDRDQQIQQMIEEIGAEEGLNETELAIVYQAYLEVKERIYYTSSLVDLWNQIEEVQKRMSMLHTYDSLEEDLFGNVLGDDKEDIIISNESYLGKGASHNNDVYAMEQVQLSDIPVQHDSTVGMNHIKLNELHSMGGLFTGSGESSQHEISDLDEDIVEHMDVNPLDGVESLEVHHLDEENPFDAENSVLLSKSKDTETSHTNEDASAKKDSSMSKHEDTFNTRKSAEDKFEDIDEDMSSIDPYTAVNALLFGKAGLDSDKANKKMEKLLKKQLKRVDDEWARINGTDDTSKKSKDYKKFKEDKKSKGDKKSKEDKKSKDDKKSKEDKKDKKHKKSKEDKHSKSEDKLKKKKDKAEKKLKVLNDKLKTVFLGDTFKKKDKKKDKQKDKKSEKDGSEKKQKR